MPWCITDAIDPFPTLAGSRSALSFFPPLGCDGHHKMVDLRLIKRRAAEPGGSCAHLKGWMRERIR